MVDLWWIEAHRNMMCLLIRSGLLDDFLRFMVA